MAIRETLITVTLDPSSIQAAIEALEEEKTKLDTRFPEALRSIAEIVRDKAAEGFGNGIDGVDVEAAPSGNGFDVVARGKAVGFIEFGTGHYADPSHEYAKNAPYIVAPGSYSRLPGIGAGTYDKWVAKHGNDWDYPFNRLPRRPLYNAMIYAWELASGEVKEKLND